MSFAGIIEYNYQIVKEGIQRMLSVNQHAIKSMSSSNSFPDPKPQTGEHNPDAVAGAINANNRTEDPAA